MLACRRALLRCGAVALDYDRHLIDPLRDLPYAVRLLVGSRGDRIDRTDHGMNAVDDFRQRIGRMVCNF